MKKSFWPLTIIIIGLFIYNSGTSGVVFDFIKKQSISYKKLNVSTDSFSLNNISDLRIYGNSLQGVGEKNDPLMVFNMPAESQYIKKISLDIFVNEPTVLQLFFRTDKEPNFSEVNSLRTAITEGNNRVIITLPIKHSVKKIQSIRIDPVEGNQEFKISNIIIN
ncbi:hypothetical protein [Paenibacillus alvei]|uniref:hypothetical protein n=1 Tax=Paenibacillus alvei TaxID=44250 RepID=UPI002282341E|nr:hypothetical protein [Paenibacillus alvei]